MPVLYAIFEITGVFCWLLWLALAVLAVIYRKKIFTTLAFGRQYLAIYQRMKPRKNFEPKG